MGLFDKVGSAVDKIKDRTTEGFSNIKNRVTDARQRAEDRKIVPNAPYGQVETNAQPISVAPLVTPEETELEKRTRQGFERLLDPERTRTQERGILGAQAVSAESGRRELEGSVQAGGFGGPQSTVGLAGARDFEAGVVGATGKTIAEFETQKDAILAQVLPQVQQFNESLRRRGDAKMQQAYDFVTAQYADAQQRNDDEGSEFWANALQPIADELGVPFKPFKKGLSVSDQLLETRADWQSKIDDPNTSPEDRQVLQGLLDASGKITQEEGFTDTDWGSFNSTTGEFSIDKGTESPATFSEDDFINLDTGEPLNQNSATFESDLSKILKEKGVDTNALSKNDLVGIRNQATSMLNGGDGDKDFTSDPFSQGNIDSAMRGNRDAIDAIVSDVKSTGRYDRLRVADRPDLFVQNSFLLSEVKKSVNNFTRTGERDGNLISFVVDPPSRGTVFTDEQGNLLEVVSDLRVEPDSVTGLGSDRQYIMVKSVFGGEPYRMNARAN